MKQMFPTITGEGLYLYTRCGGLRAALPANRRARLQTGTPVRLHIGVDVRALSNATTDDVCAHNTRAHVTPLPCPAAHPCKQPCDLHQAPGHWDRLPQLVHVDAAGAGI